ncbi:MAG TPA: PIG-L family deacetylase [Bacteroidota bacterium]|nr:PIG-L family deacetylase [Bacteroidota bacterium]
MSRILKIILVLLCPALLAVSSFAQQAGHPSLTLMSLSAHPDDEGGGTLAYYGKLKGVSTFSIYFTRGEGGQNEIGSELYEDLGILRTRETLEAAKILGAEAHFLGFRDFGFSKTAKETFSMWGGKDSVLARLVYVIRALKPDVIITNHDTVTTKPNRQHGNHQAVGISAYQAFEKASDPSYHPEQLHDSITPWQVKKLFIRYFDRDSALLHQAPVVIDVRQKDSTGASMYDVAVAALQKHRSQGMLRPSPNQRYYLLRQNKNYPFDGLDVFSGIDPSVREIVALQDPPPPPHSALRDFGDPTKARAKRSEHINVGLVKTYDDTIEKVLTACSIPMTLLDPHKFERDDLTPYSVIILDLRTYQYRQDIERYRGRLFEYIRKGGNVVAFYNKTDDWSGKNPAPYPITITSERVTEEDAKVTMLLRDHPLLSTPNRITADDWNGWIQERSIYLPSDDTAKTSRNYKRLLSMSDTDEQQPPTSLLWATYGKGTYTYCALALYRQLRIANEGAIKLFFNMLSQPRH